ncbi:ABC transporter permease [Sporolactobacillus terrae]|uniref:DUF3533 domain-containing protein n=1 Tax=Sporolactobacillus terrae TaxID=269673 RepID=A0ABX5Q3Y6_9BACL|nr:ABC transporter permease [Sporolactobacillus terrae]QAA21362.1 DUF3533 domain-containing protein [Sporolactobacillus terrae]QAA24334.1 DUF3533 domain-containing protein [Sporolactobacillus terrae]UAK16155.1 ABC transporter permease [Sporolactobacillus terrae]
MKNKLIWVIPIVASLILMVLSTAFYPAYNPKAKNIPLAVVNNDHGVEAQGSEINIGKQLVDTMTSSKNGNNTIEWHKIKNEKELTKGLKNKEYVGAIIIDKNFSQNAMSYSQSIIIKQKQAEMKEKIDSGQLSKEQIEKMKEQVSQSSENQLSKPQNAEIKIVANEGANPQLAQAATQILSGMTTKINEQISNQNIQILSDHNIDVPGSDIRSLKDPIKVDSQSINKIKEHQASGNAQGVMFTPIWLASMIISVLTFFVFRNNDKLLSTKQKSKNAILLPIGMIVSSFIGGFVYVYYTDWVMSFDFNQPAITAVYISFAIVGFSSLLVGIMSWIGLATIPIFILFLFFTIQSVMLPKQMIPEFYQNYIVPWNPFGHYMSTLRDILYTGADLTSNGTIWMFLIFTILGLGSLIIATYAKKKSIDIK